MESKFPFAFFLSTLLLMSSGAAAREKKAEVPLGWGYARQGSIIVRPGLLNRNVPVLSLGRGALVTILEEKPGKSKPSTRVRAVNPATLETVTGWVEASSIDHQPPGEYPSDEDLLKQLGGEYLQDITTSNARVARYLLRQGNREPALVCFIGAQILPSARLQVFQKSGGKYVPGAFIDFPTSEMQFAITDLDVRDLLGDGNEFLITREPFRVLAQDDGVNMVIRRLEVKQLVTVWTAPIQFRNTASYMPQRQTLAPPENNIGAPGTITSGAVEFRAHGTGSEPVWKGKVDFLVIGRDQPVDSLNLEKACPWDGFKFAPLR
ncbi:MAG TPA: hypothetical protein VKV95_14675 [Terriglobia bacterium]|nr:hypothetical protein [Terriglobia bacterium]